MTDKPQDQNQLTEAEAQEIMHSLLKKEGSWVDWGKSCQKLQKSGYGAQQIFEVTGFQGSQQNLVIVAAQVYDTLVQSGASQEVLQYFLGPRSDVLYEFRILDQTKRLKAAELAMEKRLDVDGAHDVAKAYQSFSRLSQLPEGFTTHPGDAMAYQCWRSARSKRDLQDRSRLIAQGLKFAHSPTAREKIEQLLTDFTLIPKREAPMLPLYRLEMEEELPRIVPVAGKFPITKEKLEAIPQIETFEPFRVIHSSGEIAFVPIPGWQVVLKAENPVAIFCQSDQLPKVISGKPEEVVVIVDRGNCTWDVNNYLLVEQEGNLEIQWFENAPEVPILGQVLIVLRPKSILDENNITEPWQMDD